MRCRDASVLDIGCNRGMISYELALNGATLCHGVDNYADGVRIANEIFADIRAVEGRFEVVDLRGGMKAITAAFGDQFRRNYDIVVYMAVHHKLQRVMGAEPLARLVIDLAHCCQGYFLFRGGQPEFDEIEPVLTMAHLELVQWSHIPHDDAPAAIWRRRP
jgi:SAM-dependent methyltransferase